MKIGHFYMAEHRTFLNGFDIKILIKLLSLSGHRAGLREKDYNE